MDFPFNPLVLVEIIVTDPKSYHGNFRTSDKNIHMDTSESLYSKFVVVNWHNVQVLNFRNQNARI
jgi:hypothetical protein